MADLIVLGMEMPKGCGVCPFRDEECFGAWKCWRVKDWGDDDSRAKGCPLLPLPEGHGRLIDGDAIVAEMEKQVTERDKIMELCKRVRDMENYFRCSNNQTEIVSFVRMLNNAPTIVPAEGGNADDSQL